jgi:hypothetical protein
MPPRRVQVQVVRVQHVRPANNRVQGRLVHSPYREFFDRFLGWLRELTATHPERHVIVLIPELVQRRWYQFIISHRAMRLKAALLIDGDPHVSVMSTPWYPDLSQAQSRR